MARTYRQEVAVVEAADLSQLHSLRHCYYRCIYQPQREVDVLLHQLGDSVEILKFQLRNVESVRAEGTQEGRYSLGANTRLE